MTTATLTLSAFLLARIEEDELVARAATSGSWAHNPRKEWFTDPDKLRAARAGIEQSGGEEHVSAADGAVGVAATGPSSDQRSMADATHIARHDPARVLAECKAKRAIVELHDPSDVDRNCGFQCRNGICPSLRILASVYANHPDFNPDWS